MSASLPSYVAALPESQRPTVEKLLSIIESVLPGAGAIWHGHPMWSLGPAPGKSPVCLVKPYASYVTFALWRGQELNDSAGRLEPGSKTMAGVKLRSVEDIDANLFTDWLRQARALES
jgi:hypothetical protein